MKNLKTVMRLFFLLLFVSCGTAELTIRANPDGADVFVKELGSPERSKIGTTPIQMTLNDFLKVSGVKEAPILIEIDMMGHYKQQIIMTELPKGDQEYTFDLEVKSLAASMKQIDQIGYSLFEAQKLIRSRQYDDALKVLEKVTQKYPKSSLANELRGGVFFFKKDYVKSLYYYDLAFRYDPENIEAYKMKEMLEKEMGVKRPLDKKEGEN